jgi:sulfatase modifying factor 1
MKFFAIWRTAADGGGPIQRVFLLISRSLSAAVALSAVVFAGATAAQGLSIQLVPAGNATLSWNATASGPVNVERSGNLTVWSVVSEGNSNGTFTEATGGAARRFYRLSKMVPVQGNATIASFMVSNTETTWGEWVLVRDWAAANGYDIGSAGNSTGGTALQPVHSVSWYDALKWCNARSQMEGRTPAYTVNGTAYKTGETVPQWNTAANGYRLPTEAEWTWAAAGGNRSQGYTYSGGNDVGAVAWYDRNSGGGPQRVGTKAGNELAIFDMSGNLFEWCWDEQADETRGVRGGSWGSEPGPCEIIAAFEDYPDGGGLDIGFRPVRGL